MTSAEKILCELVFKGGSKQGLEKIVGEINMKQLFSPDNNWIAVETKILEGTSLRIVENIVNKADVEKITFYKPQVFLTVNKGDYGLNKMIKNQPRATAV